MKNSKAAGSVFGITVYHPAIAHFHQSRLEHHSALKAIDVLALCCFQALARRSAKSAPSAAA